MPKWGPIFSIDIDVKLGSLEAEDKALLNLIQFIESTRDIGPGCCDLGSAVPSIKLHQKQLQFSMGFEKLVSNLYKVKKGKWYEILITQKLEDEKVTIESYTEIHS